MTAVPRTGARRRWGRIAALVVVAAMALTGCDDVTSVQDAPLPGGAALGSNPYSATVMLSNVVDLVPNDSVRVNDVPVGVVRTVGLAPDGWTAQARVEVNGNVMLPANAIARLRQTSLLGEKYVELASPPGAPQGRLTNGAVIGMDRTDVGAQVEEVLGALSLLLNGGGVEKVQSIAREINNATSGNEPQLRQLLDNLNTFVGTLDKQKGDINHALDSLDRLTRTLNDQRAKLANVIDNLGPGLDVLNAERGDLVTMLQSLQRLGGVATDVINRSQTNTVADLNALSPILGKLVESGNALPQSLQILVTIPFTDKSLTVAKGDYANITATVDLNLQDVFNNLLGGPAIPGLNDIFKTLTPGTATASPLGRLLAGPSQQLQPGSVLPNLLAPGAAGRAPTVPVPSVPGLAAPTGGAAPSSTPAAPRLPTIPGLGG